MHELLAGGYTLQTTFAGDDWRRESPEFQADRFTRNLAVVERLKGMAARHGITVAHLAVAWVLANPAVDVAVVGACNRQQIEQTAAATDIHLTPETLDDIEQVMRDAVAVGGPSPEGM